MLPWLAKVLLSHMISLQPTQRGGDGEHGLYLHFLGRQDLRMWTAEKKKRQIRHISRIIIKWKRGHYIKGGKQKKNRRKWWRALTKSEKWAYIQVLQVVLRLKTAPLMLKVEHYLISEMFVGLKTWRSNVLCSIFFPPPSISNSTQREKNGMPHAPATQVHCIKLKYNDSLFDK